MEEKLRYCLVSNREIKQQRRLRRRKRHVQSKVALLQASSRKFHLVQFVKCWQFFSGVKFWKRVTKFRKRKTKSLFCVHVLHNTWNWAFSRRSRAVTAKPCTKKHDARAVLLFCQSKPIPVLPFSLTSPSSLLKLPNLSTLTYIYPPITALCIVISNLCFFCFRFLFYYNIWHLSLLEKNTNFKEVILRV